jgi:hypothetical protein
MDTLTDILKSAAAGVKVPPEWEVKNELRINDDTLTLVFSGGAVVIVDGGAEDAEASIRLDSKRLCNYIDGTIDYMTVWRELAEPSPTDRTYMQKGSGAKFFMVLDALIQRYRKDGGFQLEFDKCKKEYSPNQ